MLSWLVRSVRNGWTAMGVLEWAFPVFGNPSFQVILDGIVEKLFTSKDGFACSPMDPVPMSNVIVATCTLLVV